MKICGFGIARHALPVHDRGPRKDIPRKVSTSYESRPKHSVAQNAPKETARNASRIIKYVIRSRPLFISQGMKDSSVSALGSKDLIPHAQHTAPEPKATKAIGPCNADQYLLHSTPQNTAARGGNNTKPHSAGSKVTGCKIYAI